MTGVLLAAGESARMGRPKALLPFRRSTFSRSIATAMLRAGVQPVLVVLGHNPGTVAAHLADLGVRFVYNRRWPKGQLSSLQAAIAAVPKKSSGLMVCLVDQPGLKPATIRRMAATHRRFGKNILVASRRKRAGHPVVFPRKFFRDLLATPAHLGARAVIRRHSEDRRFIAVGDPAVLRDVDTKRDYRSLTCS